LVVVVIAGASLAVAGLIYGAGLRITGLQQTGNDQELDELRTQVARLSAELAAANTLSDSSESRLRIESTSQERLSAQIKTLEEENTRLQTDLAMFESLAGGPQGAVGFALSRLQVDPAGAPGQYRYRFFLSQTGGKREKEFKGVIQLVASAQRGKEAVMMQFPSAGDATAGQYQVSFRYFQRMEGTFKLAADMRLMRLEARLVQDGVVKASQSVTL